MIDIKNRNVFIIGTASGKTTLARDIAEKYGHRVLHVDHLISERSARGVPTTEPTVFVQPNTRAVFDRLFDPKRDVLVMMNGPGTAPLPSDVERCAMASVAQGTLSPERVLCATFSSFKSPQYVNLRMALGL